jgi:hypothetical protein
MNASEPLAQLGRSEAMREPTHPQTPSPTSEDRAQLRALAPIGVVVLAILVTFVALFLAAFHDPKPNGLEVAVVGQPALQQRLQEHVGRAGIGKLDFTRYTSPAEARAAVRDGDVQGALIVEAGRPRLLVASAGSFIVAQALEDILGRAAAANGARPAVEDVRPLPKHDSRGLSAVFVTFGTVIPSFMLGAALWMLGGAARPRVLAALIGAFAIVAGLLAALTADTVIGALDGQFWGLAGLVALLAVAVAAPVAGLGRLAGPASRSPCSC